MSESQLKINQIVMEKLDKLGCDISDIKVLIAKLPQVILESADDRYASKESEVRLRNLEARIESRTYDWLKQFAVTLITIIIGFSIYNKF